MAIFLRPNEFAQPDYSVVYRHDDGRELSVGRIFKNDGIAGRPWFWGLEFHQAHFFSISADLTEIEPAVAPRLSTDKWGRLRKPKPHGASVGTPQPCRFIGRLH
jgi:hypothetical protein